jgi:hypothetical protein
MRYALAILFSLATFAAAPALKAQEAAAKLELYGGYSYIRFNITYLNNGHPAKDNYNGSGGTGEIVYNPTNWFGVVGDAGGFWATNANAYGAAIPYLFGTRFNLRRHLFTPFAQVLFAGVVTSSGIETLGWQSHIALATGAGIDFKISRHVSLRPLQAQYFMTKIPDGLNNRQNNFQVSAGVSLLFGRR